MDLPRTRSRKGAWRLVRGFLRLGVRVVVRAVVRAVLQGWEVALRARHLRADRLRAQGRHVRERAALGGAGAGGRRLEAWVAA